MSFSFRSSESQLSSRPQGLIIAMSAAAALLASLITVSVPSPATALPGTLVTVDDIVYAYDNDALATDRTAVIREYVGSGGAITIPENVTLPVEGGSTGTYRVTEIAQDSFRDSNITSVTIPNSVETIAADAFYNNNLTSLVIPDSVTSIGVWAFANNALASVVIPDSITAISDYSFVNNALTSLVIPDSVTTIGMYAFSQNSLTSLTLGSSVTEIGTAAFFTHELTSVTIPASVAVIGTSAFLGNAASTVVTFEGPAPLIAQAGITGSFGPGVNVTLIYMLGAGVHTGAVLFSEPLWLGYHSQGVAAPVITTDRTLPEAVAGEVYSLQLATTGAPAPTFAVTDGVLPAGLTLSAEGLITGTPTSAGTATATITATNSLGYDTQQFSLTVQAAPVAPMPPTRVNTSAG